MTIRFSKPFLATLFIYNIYLIGIEAPSPITEEVKETPSIETELTLHLLQDKKLPNDPLYWYQLGLVYIQLHDLNHAEKSLKRSIDEDTHFTPAYIQLGYLYLWNDELSKAVSSFSTALEQEPCNENALIGIEKIASIWRKKRGYKQQAIDLYKKLLSCRETDADYLFYLGTLFAHTGQLKQAEKALKHCLAIVPTYTDAAFQLASVYIWQKKWDLAISIYEKYPDRIEAEEGLARISFLQENYAKAEIQYKEILSKDPSNLNARKGLARSDAAQLHYKDAKKQYKLLQKTPGYQEINAAEIFDTKSHTNIAALLEADYTVAKENDPTIQLPVVKDYYLNTGLWLLFPIFDQWRIDAKGIFYHQKELDILPPVGLNYDVNLGGAQLVSHYYFLKDWKWDVVARVLRGWQAEDGAYPFNTTTRFEPGTSILYNSERQLLLLDGHYESFITKNFSNFHAQQITTAVLEGRYGYRFDMHLRPEITGWLNHMFYHDSVHNQRSSQNIKLKIDVPFLDPFLFATYLFEHSSFRTLTTSYFSYKDQWRNTVGGLIHFQFSPRFYWDAFYERQWQLTEQLFQPIGNFVFIAARQFLIGNKVGGALTYYLTNFLQVNIS
ncbi:MAG: hypothetical protein HY860_01930, partial [Chlamydiales bacterium]|nr:hypothetical protein [Chlamydiales bacterium]